MAFSPTGANQDKNNSVFKVFVEVSRYSPEGGVSTRWEEGSYLRGEVTQSPEPTIVISGNPAGLFSLARHLLTLAQAAIPDGSHLDFDTYSGVLTSDSHAFRIEIEK